MALPVFWPGVLLLLKENLFRASERELPLPPAAKVTENAAQTYGFGISLSAL